jgi:uncharacterized protein (DUF1501 family)
MSFENENTRREFLKTAAAFGMAGSALTFDSVNNIAVAATPIGGPGTTEVGNEYKAIVCVYLYGGQDHSNILIPWLDGNAAGTGTAATFHEYTAYAHWRSNYKSTDPDKKIQSMRRLPDGATPRTGNLSYARTGKPKFENGTDVTESLQLADSTLPATFENALTSAPGSPNPNPTVGGWTTNSYGRQFALNPCYAELRNIYLAGKLAIISNVGPMLQKATRHQWYTQYSSLKRPVNLYSHDDQTKCWMSGTSDVANPNVGIGGRIADLAEIKNLNSAGGLGSKVATQISIYGSNTFMLSESGADPSATAYQMGSGSYGRFQTTNGVTTCNTSTTYINANTTPYCMQGGPIRLSSGFVNSTQIRATTLARYTGTAEGVSIYHDQWRQVMSQSMDTQAAIDAAFAASPTTEDVIQPFVGTDSFNGSGNDLAQRLRMVAAMIRASSQLGPNASTPIKRQIFFVGLGSFDNHGEEFWYDTLYQNRKISIALNAFWTALGRIAVVGSADTAQKRVTTFTMSEFGRTLDSNGDGSDHGWGNFQLVMGGAVKGGKIYGQSHNVAASDIPVDGGNDIPIAQRPTQKSRYMGEDLRAGAVPRVGLPPTTNSTAAAARVKMATQSSAAVTTPPADSQVPNIPNTTTIHLNHSLGRGEWMPTMASDAMVATIAKWFGVDPDDITGASPAGKVFPTLHGVHGDNWDVGFMDPA